MGARGRSERAWKSSPALGFDRRTDQPVAVHDCAIPAHNLLVSIQYINRIPVPKRVGVGIYQELYFTNLIFVVPSIML